MTIAQRRQCLSSYRSVIEQDGGDSLTGARFHYEARLPTRLVVAATSPGIPIYDDQMVMPRANTRQSIFGSASHHSGPNTIQQYVLPRLRRHFNRGVHRFCTVIASFVAHPITRSILLCFLLPGKDILIALWELNDTLSKRTWQHRLPSSSFVTSVHFVLGQAAWRAHCPIQACPVWVSVLVRDILQVVRFVSTPLNLP
jgi:hypothetical protein